MTRKTLLIASVFGALVLLATAGAAGAQVATGAFAVGELPVELDVSIRGSHGDVVAGATLTWDYAVTNVGDTELTGLIVDDAAEGRVCLISVLSPGATTRCSIRTQAGIADYATTASVTGQAGIEPIPALVTAVRSYTVTAGQAPDDLAFVEVPRVPGQPIPAWPVDRWGRYATVGLIAAMTAGFAARQIDDKRSTSPRR